MSANHSVALSDPDLIDWSKPGGSPACSAYEPFGSRGSFLALPRGIKVGIDAAGNADLKLSLVRSQTGDANYADFQIRLCADYQLNQAVESGEVYSGALAPAPLRGGAMVLRPMQLLELPKDLLQPVQLDWNALGASRLTLRLSAEAGTVLREALERGLTILSACFEVEIAGVAPLHDLTVNIAAQLLHSRIASAADSANRVAREDLMAMFLQELPNLPMQFNGDPSRVNAVMLAESLIDRVRNAWGTTPRSPREDNKPAIQLEPGQMVLDENLNWDLSRPVVGLRSMVLSFDPLAAVRNVSGLIVEATIPPLATGFHRITIDANLPSPRLGSVALEATARLPAHLPARGFEIKRSITFNAGQDSGAIDVRIAPNEKLQWLASTTVILPQPGRAERFKSPEKPANGSGLVLTRDDFAANFVEFEIGHGLASLARAEGEITATRKGAAWNLSFSLAMNNLHGALALPTDLQDAVVHFKLIGLFDGATIVLPPRPLQACKLDLHNVPGYGAQSVLIDCTFDTDDALAAVEFRGEDESNVETIAFTREKPSRSWRWLSRSPFRSGCYWRWHANAEEPSAPWRGPVAFGSCLEIQTSEKG